MTEAVAGSAHKSEYAPAAPRDSAAFRDTRIALIGTRWNAELVDALVAGSWRCLEAFGVARAHVTEVHVPGAFELPLAAEVLMRSGRVDAVVALGAVIRGETPHFDYVCTQCSQGLREASQLHRIALGFGVLTTENVEQARARAGDGRTNKGYEATAAALEMVALIRSLS
ncbi:MAG: 6,7-dimethyl-8-ribityllumazine synthase [Nevskiaceae bacterium]|nr:MAG: 6,7-dimethyl-8-ribityllumazine synthase [Nevskiaceae bacterium]TBR74735.1 MAG: 6,7-dimethyl-8-ribityllumazine synthase [Nevskiaceae bacterium]